MNGQMKFDVIFFFVFFGGQFSFQSMQRCSLKSPTIGMKTKVNLLKIYNLTEHVHCAPFISKAMNSIDWRQSFFFTFIYLRWLLLLTVIGADAAVALTFVTNADFKCWSLFQIRFDYDDEKWNCFLLCSEESWVTPAFYTLCGSLSYVCEYDSMGFAFVFFYIRWHFFHLLFFRPFFYFFLLVFRYSQMLSWVTQWQK